MPDRKTIFEHLRQLPTIPLGKIAGDREIWEDNEYGAHFKVTKEQFFLSEYKKWITLYALSISGSLRGREKVTDDFINTLGPALMPISNSPLWNSPIDYGSWDANYVDTNLLNKL